MDQIKTGAAALCIFLIISGCVLFLAPKGGLEKPFKFVVSLMSVAMIISALFVNFNFDMSDINFAEYGINDNMGQSVKSTYLKAARREVASLISDTLETIDIDNAKISADMNISEDNSISINKVTVFLDDKDKAKADSAYQLLRSQIGGNIEVKTEEENK